MISAGKLRYPVTFEKREITKDALGQPQENWVMAFRTFCRIERGQVDTVSGDDANIVISDLKVTVRKTSSTSKLAATHYRAVIDSQEYEIREIDKFLSDREITVYISNYD